MSQTLRPRPLPLSLLHPEALRAALQAVEPPYPGPRLQPRPPGGEPVPRPTGPPPGQLARQAAVLLLFYPRRGDLTVLLIRRPEYDGPHSGQIALPGGAIESHDPSPLAAALREAREEVGVSNERLSLWGRLEPIYVQTSNFQVQPFLAWSEARPRLRPDPNEVAGLVEARLAALLDPRTIEEEEWPLHGENMIVPFFRIGPHKVWGATAQILDQVRWRLEHALNSNV